MYNIEWCYKNYLSPIICLTAYLICFRDRFFIQNDVTFFNLLHIFRDIFSNKQNLSPCVQRFNMHTHSTIHLLFYKYSVYVKRDQARSKKGMHVSSNKRDVSEQSVHIIIQIAHWHTIVKKEILVSSINNADYFFKLYH